MGKLTASMLVKNTGLTIAECPAEASNVCTVHRDLTGDMTVKADFITEMKWQWVDMPERVQYDHNSVCAAHLVDLVQNYRDIERG